MCEQIMKDDKIKLNHLYFYAKNQHCCLVFLFRPPKLAGVIFLSFVQMIAPYSLICSDHPRILSDCFYHPLFGKVSMFLQKLGIQVNVKLIHSSTIC